MRRVSNRLLKSICPWPGFYSIDSHCVNPMQPPRSPCMQHTTSLHLTCKSHLLQRGPLTSANATTASPPRTCCSRMAVYCCAIALRCTSVQLKAVLTFHNRSAPHDLDNCRRADSISYGGRDTINAAMKINARRSAVYSNACLALRHVVRDYRSTCAFKRLPPDGVPAARGQHGHATLHHSSLLISRGGRRARTPFHDVVHSIPPSFLSEMN